MEIARAVPALTLAGRTRRIATQIGDITMPAGAEVITVWFRYSGPPCPGVGFDWIKLKDVTAK
jgi:hypothetical protein